MPSREAPPSIKAKAFNCPHCGAFTSQTWFLVSANRITKNEGTPVFPNPLAIERIKGDKDMDASTKARLVRLFSRAVEGLVAIDTRDEDRYESRMVVNLHLSLCYACEKVTVWVGNSPVHPPQKAGPEANPDLPPDVLRDYEEARSVLNLSPRGAAALLRLAIQKLCKELGEPGEHLDSDIGSLVKKGLSVVVQQSLDIVRVIGNEAVHPGTIDLRDDRDTAEKLFRLVNLIAEQMISTPKHVNSLYGSLPEEKRAAIERRDKKG